MSSGLVSDSIILTPSRPHRHSVRGAYLMMLASSVCFAVMSACSHAAGERSDWRLTALARAGLVFLFALFVAKVSRVPLVWSGPRTLWVRSLTGSVSMLLAFFALTHLHVATAVTLTNAFPLCVTLLAWPAFGQRPSLRVVVALASGITGVALVSHEAAEVTGAQAALDGFSWASAAALASAVCSAIVMLGLHRLRKVHALAIVVHFSAVATVFIGGFTIWTHFNGHPLDLGPLKSWKTISLLIGIAICATSGQILMTRAFHVASPQRLSVIGLAQVPFAMGLDLLIWERTPGLQMLLGIFLVIAPVAWLLRRKSK